MGGEREERHGSQSAHTVKQVVCVVSSERHSHSGYIPGKGRCLNGILNCSPPLSLPLARYTPQHRVLIYKNKTKTNMRALSHSDTDHCVELERVGRQLPSRPQREEVSCFRCTNDDDTQGSACCTHAKSTWII